MANIFYTFNFTVSVMLIYLFMLLFTRVTMGKAKIAATVWNGIITFATSRDLSASRYSALRKMNPT